MATPILLDYQERLQAGIYDAWHQRHRNVMCVAPTGGGKTVIQGRILANHDGPACVMAHRQELVAQLALALNREGVSHGIDAPTQTIREIVRLETMTHGQSYYNSRAHIRVAGVDTLNAREPDRWRHAVSLVIVDEGHHVLAENKWGRAVQSFPNARALMFTAHALRADGAGLGRSAEGIVDALVVGPCARELINRGFLSSYRLACPHTAVDTSRVSVGATGEYNQAQLRTAVHESKTIVGDVAQTYLRLAGGKLGITFAVDLESAADIAKEYVRLGVPAAVITGKTPTGVRAELMRQFRARELLQLVSVDVLGEGVDVPAVEVVSFARPTASFQLYAQQFGRPLRIDVSGELRAKWGTFTDAERRAHLAASSKPTALIIDHVGNWERHGLPDPPRTYSLDREERRSRKGPKDAVPLRVCSACLQPYERITMTCPYCGHVVEVKGRKTPEMVDGCIEFLDPDILLDLLGEIARIDGPPAEIGNYAGRLAQAGLNKTHTARQQAQTRLRAVMSAWDGWQASQGHTVAGAQMRFFHRYGRDVLSAQALGRKEADELHDFIAGDLRAVGIMWDNVAHTTDGDTHEH